MASLTQLHLVHHSAYSPCWQHRSCNLVVIIIFLIVIIIIDAVNVKLVAVAGVLII